VEGCADSSGICTGVEITLDRQANAATHHAIAVATAKRSAHARDSEKKKKKKNGQANKT
jgi:hypothetical protein